MSPTSGLQKSVLSLYRRALRMVNSKPSTTRPKFLLFVRYTFRANAAALTPRHVGAVEHLLRRGERQIEMYESESVKDCWVSEEMMAWSQSRNRRDRT